MRPASCATGGTLDALIPPSISFVIYGIFAEVSIVKLLIAGIIPGILTAVVYLLMIILRCWCNPSLAPPIAMSGQGGALARTLGVARRHLADRRADRRRHRRPLHGGRFADRRRRGRRLPRDADRRRAAQLTWQGFIDAFKDAMSTTAQLFFVGMGAVLYTKFLALSGTAECSRNWSAPGRSIRCCS